MAERQVVVLKTSVRFTPSAYRTRRECWITASSNALAGPKNPKWIVVGTPSAYREKR